MTNESTGLEQTAGEFRTEWNSAGNGGFANDKDNGGLSGAASGLADAAQEYAGKISDAVSQAKDYLGDKATAVGGKVKDFATDDLGEYAEKAKDFARQKPGQAILISAAAGLLLGLIVRGRR
jgi:ElaB/YqjD/DUF883 family membrane-anchored ribosome-binding protein